MIIHIISQRINIPIEHGRADSTPACKEFINSKKGTLKEPGRTLFIP
jgi:hypothetical protein